MKYLDILKPFSGVIIEPLLDFIFSESFYTINGIGRESARWIYRLLRARRMRAGLTQILKKSESCESQIGMSADGRRPEGLRIMAGVAD